MTGATSESIALRAAVAAQRGALDAILARYGAVNPRLFSSVARGRRDQQQRPGLLVDLLPARGNELLRVAGIAEELGEVLGMRVDVVSTTLLRGDVSASALSDAVAV